jgi:flagellar export protein FliJ
MAFRFTLATVLRFRESVEKREELALQRILLEMARVRREIERITAEIAAAHEARNRAMQNPLPASYIQGLLNDTETAAERRRNLVQALAALEKQHLLQTQKYQAAHRDRQMLSDMKAKKRDVYEQERARATQKVLDDIFAARSHRN